MTRKPNRRKRKRRSPAPTRLANPHRSLRPAMTMFIARSKRSSPCKTRARNRMRTPQERQALPHSRANPARALRQTTPHQNRPNERLQPPLTIQFKHSRIDARRNHLARIGLPDRETVIGYVGQTLDVAPPDRGFVEIG